MLPAYLLALLSGILLGLATSPVPLLPTLLTATCFYPLLKALEETSPPKALLLGFTTGLLGHLVSLHWIFNTSPFGWVVAASLLGLQPALWAYLLTQLQVSHQPTKVAALWTLLEIPKTLLPTTNLLPLAAHTHFPPLDFLIAKGGEESLSFFLVLICATLVAWPSLNPQKKILYALFFTAFLLPNKTPTPPSPNPTSLRVTLIPANIGNVRDVEEKNMWMEQSLARTKLAAQESPSDLILWSEGTPFAFPNNEKFGEKILALVEETNTGLLITGPHHSPKGRFNSSFLLTPTPNGITLQEHKKTVLTAPEGSPSWWPSDPNQNFQKGPPSHPLTFQNHALGVLLCAEEVAPHHARGLRQKGAQIFLGANSHLPMGSWGTYQALRCARLRALETQTPIVRCTNLGTSSLIAPDGQILWESNSQNPKQITLTPARPPSPLLNPAVYLSPWGPILLSALLLFIPPRFPARKRNS